MRAKFYLYSKTEYSGADTVNLIFQAVTKDTEENKTFWKYTPSGKLEMSVRQEAGDWFVIGKEYYLDFTPTSEE